MKKAQPLLFSKKHDLCHDCSPPCPTFAANKQEARRPRRARMCGGDGMQECAVGATHLLHN